MTQHINAPPSEDIYSVNKPYSQSAFFHKVKSFLAKQSNKEVKNNQVYPVLNKRVVKYGCGLLLSCSVLFPIVSVVLFSQGATYTSTKFGFKLADLVQFDYHTESRKLEDSTH